jgi:predicted Fe-Mo cluster-binding NifX family protein
MKSTMRIAVVTDDGINISPHFGRAHYYEVVTIENGVPTSRERRAKVNHDSLSANLDEHNPSLQQGHEKSGMDENAGHKHGLMAEAIKDCDMVLARGMGYGAYQGMLERGIKPVVTDIRKIEEAVQAVINGTIVDHTERLH